MLGIGWEDLGFEDGFAVLIIIQEIKYLPEVLVIFFNDQYCLFSKLPVGVVSLLRISKQFGFFGCVFHAQANIAAGWLKFERGSDLRDHCISYAQGRCDVVLIVGYLREISVIFVYELGVQI